MHDRVSAAATVVRKTTLAGSKLTRSVHYFACISGRVVRDKRQSFVKIERRKVGNIMKKRTRIKCAARVQRPRQQERNIDGATPCQATLPRVPAMDARHRRATAFFSREATGGELARVCGCVPVYSHQLRRLSYAHFEPRLKPLWGTFASRGGMLWGGERWCLFIIGEAPRGHAFRELQPYYFRRYSFEHFTFCVQPSFALQAHFYRISRRVYYLQSLAIYHANLLLE